MRVTRKRVQRLSREEGLTGRRRARQRVAVPRAPRLEATTPTQHWSMDVVRDALGDGRRFRALTIVDDYTRECPAIDVDHSLPAARIVAVVERLARTRGVPDTITCDNGPEFRSATLAQWAATRGVHLHFSDPGKPVQNAYAESFNGRLRDACLNEHWCVSLADAIAPIEAWRIDDHLARPHSGLAGGTPSEFVAAYHEGRSLSHTTRG